MGEALKSSVFVCVRGVHKMLSPISLLFLCLPAFAQVWRNVSLSTGVALSTLFSGAPLGHGTRTVLFLHGFPEGAYTWWPVLSSGAFPSSYTLVAPDQRGYNRSVAAGGSSDDALSVPLLASDIFALIDFLGGKVDLVAHDWGGGVAFWVAAASPERLFSLSVVNMCHPSGWIEGVRSVPAQQAASAYVLTFIKPGFAAYLTADDCAELKGWFSGEPFWPALNDSLLSAWRVPGSVDRGLGCVFPAQRTSTPPSLTRTPQRSLSTGGTAPTSTQSAP